MSENKIISCPVHKNYKGLTPTKRNCENCNRIYEAVQAVTNKYGKYKSISTPNLKCGLAHLLAELCCTMLYGQQPAYFWRESSTATKKSRAYFHEITKKVKGWQKQEPELLKPLSKILYFLYFREYQKQQISQGIEFIEMSDEQKELFRDDPGFESIKTKWEILKELADGQKKEKI
jgi:hypothetical protein